MSSASHLLPFPFLGCAHAHIIPGASEPRELNWLFFKGRKRCLHYFISLYATRNAWSTTRKSLLWPAWERLNTTVISLQWRHNGSMASQITRLTIGYSTVYSGTGHRKHQSSTSLAFVRVINWWPVNSPHKGRVPQKMFPFDDVIMMIQRTSCDKRKGVGLHPFWHDRHDIISPFDTYI